MDEESKFKLEQMIDRYSVEDVLATLAAICQEKAEHYAVSWQDTTSAKVWLAQAASILVTATSAQRRGI